MYTQLDNNQKDTHRSDTLLQDKKKSEGGSVFSEFEDNRPEMLQLKKLKGLSEKNAETNKIAQFQQIAEDHSGRSVQMKKNNTGLPDNLKSGMENLSGYSLDDVNVHYNSDKPAQLQAHAYAQGTDIHLAPGQEKHLPHEAWHVVQQKQGRVQPTKQLKETHINDDSDLEQEADVMGQKALDSMEEEPGKNLQNGAVHSTAQLREIDMGGHGRLEIGDFAQGLTPDDPVYGSPSALLGDSVATSMNVLVTPNHPAGSSPKEQNHLFSQLPTIGKYKLPANLGKSREGSNIYIKGHLLNDNLGGPGTAYNLVPITHQANMDHDNLVEEPIKEWVNKEGGIVHYQVTATTAEPVNTDVEDEFGNALLSVNASFTINVNALTTDGPEPVATGKTIESVWGNTNNGGAISFSGTPFAAPSFSAEHVNLPPRAQIKKEWDQAYFQIAEHLAEITGMSLLTWMKRHVGGVGPASIEALQSNIDYSSLNKSGKGTLSKARNLVKKFIETNYAHYLHVMGGTEAEEAELDAGNTTGDPVAADISKTNTTFDELEGLIDQIAGLSIGSGKDDEGSGVVSGPPGSSEISVPRFSESISAPRKIPEYCTQGSDFIEWRDTLPAEKIQQSEAMIRAMDYVKLIIPRGK